MTACSSIAKFASSFKKVQIFASINFLTRDAAAAKAVYLYRAYCINDDLHLQN